MMKVWIVLFFSIFLITQCSLFKKDKKTVLQDEDGHFELKVSFSADSLSEEQVEDLRIYMTLVNRYSYPVKSSPFLEFCECNVYRNGAYLHTVLSRVNMRKSLPTYIYPPDTSISVLFYVDFKQLCTRENVSIKGVYGFQAFYYNQKTDVTTKIPIWRGETKSATGRVVIY